MCEKCNKTNNLKFCPYCGNELPNEDKTPMTQETFEAIFLDMLRKANKVIWYDAFGAKSDIPTCTFALMNTDNEWMFIISLNKEKPVFWYSYKRVFRVLNKREGLKEIDIQRLMKNQLKRLFNMYGVTPHHRLQWSWKG